MASDARLVYACRDSFQIEQLTVLALCLGEGLFVSRDVPVLVLTHGPHGPHGPLRVPYDLLTIEPSQLILSRPFIPVRMLYFTTLRQSPSPSTPSKQRDEREFQAGNKPDRGRQPLYRLSCSVGGGRS
jgi:hypothetical protein